MASTAAAILDELRKNGVKYYVTVPDSLSRPLFELCTRDEGMTVVSVCHEADAVSVAAGLHIGGATNVIVFENSGFFQAIEAVRAFGIDMELPMVMLIGWVGRVKANQSADDALAESVGKRGAAGTHVTWQGVMTPQLLDTLRIPHATLESAAGAPLISWAFRKAGETRQPVAVLMDRMEAH